MKSAGCPTIGAYIQGVIDNLGISRKLIARKANLDLPTISKHLSGKLPFTERRLFNFGMAVGEVRAELRLKPAH